MSKRTKIKNRILPAYTKGENIFSMVTNIVGASLGLIALIACCIRSYLHGDLLAGISSAFYCIMVIFFYTVSSIYHGLEENLGRKVMQVITHCALYGLLAGSYMPVLLIAVKPGYPFLAGVTIMAILSICILGTVFSAIDHYKYETITMISYIVAGWFILITGYPMYKLNEFTAFILLMIGLICYSVSAIFYVKGHTKNNMHSVYQIFMLLGSIIQFIAIFGFII